MTAEFFILIAIGFGAQLIDGALGMAFGVIATSAMLAIGMPPAQASALVHTAEVFTTGASAASHIYHRNVDWRLVLQAGYRRRARRGARSMGAFERRCRVHAAVRERLSAADGMLHSVQGGTDCCRARCARRLDRAGRFRRGFPRCQRRRRLGTESPRRRWSAPVMRRVRPSVRSTPPNSVVTIAAATTFFDRARRGAAAESRAAGARRSVCGAVRRMGGEAGSRAPVDDRRSAC